MSTAAADVAPATTPEPAPATAAKANADASSGSFREYDDIPGTYVQDGRHTRIGYALNMFLLTLNEESGREAFRRGEGARLQQYGLTPEQHAAVLRRDWLAMLQTGGNIYYLLKLAAHDGVSVQHLCGQMSGVSEAEFRQMMIDGGRSPHGCQSTTQTTRASTTEPNTEPNTTMSIEANTEVGTTVSTEADTTADGVER